MTSGPVSIHIRHLSLSRGGKNLYRNFMLDIAAGQIVALVAPSGRGKTTLLDFIGGVLPLHDVQLTGSVRFGDDCPTVRPRISYLFQEGLLIRDATALQNVEFPLVNLMDKPAARQRALSFLKRTGLEKKADSYPFQLSGGERQRVSLSRAFAYPSQILLMDEAFQSQDIRIKIQLIELFRDMLSDTGRTVLFVTHEIREAVTVADRILVLDDSPVRILLDISGCAGSASLADPSPEVLETERRIVSLLAFRSPEGSGKPG